MEANAAETIFNQKLGKSFGDVMGLNNIIDFIYTQRAKGLFFIASLTQSPVSLLLNFDLQKSIRVYKQQDLVVQWNMAYIVWRDKDRTPFKRKGLPFFFSLFTGRRVDSRLTFRFPLLSL